ncbi:hypothetical protein D3C87_1700690 [compost metagenome]
MTVRAGQLQPERAFPATFAEQSAHHEAVVATSGKAPHLAAEFFGRTGKGHISRQFQNITQGCRTACPFFGHHACEGAVTRRYLESVDCLGRQPVEAVVIIGRIVEAESIL